MGFRLEVFTPFRAFTRFSTIYPSQEQLAPSIRNVTESRPSGPFVSLMMGAGADALLVNFTPEQQTPWGATTGRVGKSTFIVGTSLAQQHGSFALSMTRAGIDTLNLGSPQAQLATLVAKGEGTDTSCSFIPALTRVWAVVSATISGNLNPVEVFPSHRQRIIQSIGK